MSDQLALRPDQPGSGTHRTFTDVALAPRSPQARIWNHPLVFLVVGTLGATFLNSAPEVPAGAAVVVGGAEDLHHVLAVHVVCPRHERRLGAGRLDRSIFHASASSNPMAPSTRSTSHHFASIAC